MIPFLLGFALALGAGEAVSAQAAALTDLQDTIEEPTLHLRGLDNLNGTAQDITVRSGETVRYGHLEIFAETCRVPRENPKADAFAFLKIRDVREDAPRFAGWMFASSPALSALDHPRYDVWVVSCSSD
jgi:hypothetical protein